MININKIFKEINFKPSKRLGQNFLNNSEKTQTLITSWNLNKTDNILEIGPGLGSLTELLISKVQNIVLVEKDLKLYAFLKSKFVSKTNVEIFNKDILNFDFQNKYQNKNFKVIGNLPFSSAVKILQWCFDNKKFFTDLYLSFSEEVANKILDKKKSSFLSLICQSHSFFEQKNFIESIFFSPKPKINTSFIYFKLNSKKSIFDDQIFANFINSSFRNKRKTFINNLKSFSILNLENIKQFLTNHKISLNIRAEDINLLTFIEIYKFINK